MLELNPEDSGCLAARGEAFRRLGLAERAISDYSQAITLEPGNRQYQCARGDELYSQGKYEAAIQDYTSVLAAKPDLSGELYSQRGQAHLRLRNYREAVSDLAKAIELGRENSADFFGRGLAL